MIKEILYGIIYCEVTIILFIIALITIIQIIDWLAKWCFK
jgi:hypothetical protein